MRIELSPEVKEYLHRKHKEVLEIYVERVYYERMLEGLPHLEVKFGAPKEKDMPQFEAQEVEGFRVYIEKDLIREDQDVLIHLGKMLGMKRIEVEGLEVH